MNSPENSQEVQEEFLLGYLREEFSKFTEIRVHIRKEDGENGVLVRSEARQWFFPFEWATGSGFKLVHQQVARIRDVLD